jgi:hypothetical protein
LNPHHAKVSENRSQPAVASPPFLPPNPKLRRAVSSVSLMTSPDALARDGLAE